MEKINSIKNNIPLPIRLFLGKALLFFIVWKVIYSFFLFDSQILDKLLTQHVGDASAFVLNNTGMSGFTSVNEPYIKNYNGEAIPQQVTAIYHNDNIILNIANACNGLELLVLYVGFIVCMPSSIFRKIKYIVIGVLALNLINIIRCVGLIYLSEYYQTYFDFAHHYLFKAVIYASTFLMWMLFSRKINLKNEAL